MKRISFALAFVSLAVGCSSSKPVNLKEPRRVVGTENGVRVDAEIFGDHLTPNISLPLKYDVTNLRAETILIADLIPQANYDPDTRLVTVDIGTEIPGEEFLPRLIPIHSGEKKTFQAGVHVVIVSAAGSPWVPRPNALRLKINFLGDPKPFAQLVSIPERAVRDRKLANALFTTWVERNETVMTNTLPMRWSNYAGDDNTSAAPASTRGRRGPGT